MFKATFDRHDPKGTFRLEVSASAESMARFHDAFRKASEVIRRLGEIIAQEKRHLYRNNWWKRSETPPDWIADVAEPEWWNGGDEPPEWGCAA